MTDDLLRYQTTNDDWKMHFTILRAIPASAPLYFLLLLYVLLFLAHAMSFFFNVTCSAGSDFFTRGPPRLVWFIPTLARLVLGLEPLGVGCVQIAADPRFQMILQHRYRDNLATSAQARSRQAKPFVAIASTTGVQRRPNLQTLTRDCAERVVTFIVLLTATPTASRTCTACVCVGCAVKAPSAQLSFNFRGLRRKTWTRVDPVTTKSL